MGGPGRLQCVHRLVGPERGGSSHETSINVGETRIPGQNRRKVPEWGPRAAGRRERPREPFGTIPGSQNKYLHDALCTVMCLVLCIN